MALRLVFMGTPDFAVPTLLEILGQGHTVAAVYTRAPQRAGRGMELRPSPVEREARRFGLSVHSPATLRSLEEQQAFAALEADAAVVVAYGLILPKQILEDVRLVCLNLHASLLPRWRGAAPINRAIMAGDEKTGVCVMKMEEGLDTGPVGLIERVAIGDDMTAGELHDRLARIGADAIGRALGALERGSLAFTPQSDAGVTYAAKIDKSEARIDWAKPSRDVHNHCRGLSPFPGAWCAIGQAENRARIKVLRTTRGEGSGPAGMVLDRHLTVGCGEGAVRILQVQREGRQAMSAEDFLRGVPVEPGTLLS
jgi:methionyl-tRNA formyltransferase